MNRIPVGLVAGEGTLTGRWHLFQKVGIEDGRGCMGKGRPLRSLDRNTGQDKALSYVSLLQL